MMEVEELGIPGLLLLKPRVFTDGRGSFMEPFNAAAFAKATGLDTIFVQDNESRSKAGVIRGLHMQASPHAQAKLVRVAYGAVLDVCLDCRPESPAFGKHIAVRLDDRALHMLYIPQGFAHGFTALAENTVFQYKCSAYYAPQAERTILWNDNELKIKWGVENPIVSEKDNVGKPFSQRPWES
ncbi:MAG: dTDP-4-dehydrorhamnose 3,5-epimerase [Flavobacteriales bacterium]|jgi:dTDP-4-dehydrorhamnose 3,5-epimerase|nr:dTDP-4-dehydrorhamnose 3,5-epimerase [Flavobacteriales bacterium]